MYNFFFLICIGLWVWGIYRRSSKTLALALVLSMILTYMGMFSVGWYYSIIPLVILATTISVEFRVKTVNWVIFHATSIIVYLLILKYIIYK